jgi:hypothetical protein
MKRSPLPILLCTLGGAASLSFSLSLSAESFEADLCVYGGTSGGVAAAVQAARMGKSVILAEPGRHLGGMTSGGLSAVDIGDPRSVGGIAREYFTQLAATVGVTLAWDKAFKSAGGGPATGGAYAIEPHQAERLFDRLCSEAGVRVHRGAKLARVQKNGRRITEFVTENGTAFRARVFLDTTYEGDLMAKAGVSYTLMREGNAKYGETYNGIHYAEKYHPRTGHLMPGETGRVVGGQGVWDRDFPLDPYVIKGDPASGLLPLVAAGEPGNPGDPAPGIQAYCFRLCLTTDPANRIPIAPPPDYDPKRYEIVARFIEACLANGDAMDLRWFSKHDPLPNQKWDFNTATFGGNLPGASWAWPEATHAERAAIAKDHENYHRGLLHFLATDPRVPAKVRQDMGRFGLPKDEFTDTGGWPHQIYVREARRMVSDFVMTEHHTFGRDTAPKSIALGSYGTDVHEIRRIVKDGVVIREGKIATGRDEAPPYAIGYDAIVPKRSECSNLLVPFALSASHTAFASIRMEPVFMCMSQSAATAACLAMDDGVAVQEVDYERLKARLQADKQVLEWKPKPSAAADSASTAPARLRPMRAGTELFADDRNIARQEGVVRRIHAARKLDHPVLVADRPWERGSGIYLYGTTDYNPATGQFRMWYGRQYATSGDGVHWVKPALDVETFKGQPTNFVLPSGSGAVIVDDLEPDPAKRYKALMAEPIKVGGFSGYHSADGIHWVRYGADRILKVGSELGHVMRDPATGKYIAYIRPYPPRHLPKSVKEKRLGAVVTSDDFVHWSKMTVVLTPDAVDDAWTTTPDQRTEFYAMNGFAYGRSYLGIVPLFRITRIHDQISKGQSKFDGPMEGQLITSRDGLAWQRMQVRDPVIPGGADFDQSIMNVAVAPVIVGDEVWHYYTAINATHGAPIPPKRITIGLAKWRLDGWVSLDAGADGGVVETTVIGDRTGHLEVNADASNGRLSVEVTNADGSVLPGYAAAECGSLDADRVRHGVRWTGHAALPAGQPFKLRFNMRNTSLYSYTIVPDTVP